MSAIWQDRVASTLNLAAQRGMHRGSNSAKTGEGPTIVDVAEEPFDRSAGSYPEREHRRGVAGRWAALSFY